MFMVTFWASQAGGQTLGYEDTPELPGLGYKVHDPERPRPPVVAPSGGFSLGAGAPGDAVVLFAGGDLEGWVNRKGEPAEWRVTDQYFEVAPGTGSIKTRQEFGDFQLHLEWATPEEIVGDSQGRGNSGVKIYGLYEIQLLDSFENPSYADGQAGAMYGQYPPDRNASKAPGEWQSYDIVFEAPRFEGDKVVKKARVSVFHNGVLLHHAREFMGITYHRKVGAYDKAHPPHGPIELQDHGNPLRFRNIWIRELD